MSDLQIVGLDEKSPAENSLVGSLDVLNEGERAVICKHKGGSSVM